MASAVHKLAGPRDGKPRAWRVRWRTPDREARFEDLSPQG